MWLYFSPPAPHTLSPHALSLALLIADPTPRFWLDGALSVRAWAHLPLGMLTNQAVHVLLASKVEEQELLQQQVRWCRFPGSWHMCPMLRMQQCTTGCEHQWRLVHLAVQWCWAFVFIVQWQLLWWHVHASASCCLAEHTRMDHASRFMLLLLLLLLWWCAGRSSLNTGHTHRGRPAARGCTQAGVSSRAGGERRHVLLAHEGAA